MMNLTLQTAGKLLKDKKAGDTFTIRNLRDRMTILQAAGATGRIVKTKKENGRFKVWVIE